MLQIDNTIISLDVLEKHFVCNLESCKGNCCIDGDSGAPLSDEEIDFLETNYKKIEPYITEPCKKEILENGLYTIDSEGEKVTNLINNKDCIFVVFDGNIAKCAIEIAYNNKKIDFIKPISCHLYPIRITKYKKFTAVNYHSWDICKPALTYGKQLGVPVFKFLKEPLIRKFGTEWYKQLEIAHLNLYENKK
jgi:hypothetical protein